MWTCTCIWKSKVKLSVIHTNIHFALFSSFLSWNKTFMQLTLSNMDLSIALEEEGDPEPVRFMAYIFIFKCFYSTCPFHLWISCLIWKLRCEDGTESSSSSAIRDIIFTHHLINASHCQLYDYSCCTRNPRGQGSCHVRVEAFESQVEERCSRIQGWK